MEYWDNSNSYKLHPHHDNPLIFVFYPFGKIYSRREYNEHGPIRRFFSFLMSPPWFNRLPWLTHFNIRDAESEEKQLYLLAIKTFKINRTKGSYLERDLWKKYMIPSFGLSFLISFSPMFLLRYLNRSSYYLAPFCVLTYLILPRIAENIAVRRLLEKEGENWPNSAELRQIMRERCPDNDFIKTWDKNYPDKTWLKTYKHKSPLGFFGAYGLRFREDYYSFFVSPSNVCNLFDE